MLKIDKLSLRKQKELARNENTPGEILEQLDLAIPRIRKLIAKNPNTPSEILQSLSKDGYCERILENPAFELLMLEDPDRDFLKICLAQSVKTSVATLEKLSYGKNDRIQEAIARNPNTSPQTLAKLAKDPVKAVRKAVTINKNTSIESLIVLTENVHNFSLRKIVANNVISDRALINYRFDNSSHKFRLAKTQSSSKKRQYGDRYFSSFYQSTNNVLDSLGLILDYEISRIELDEPLNVFNYSIFYEI